MIYAIHVPTVKEILMGIVKNAIIYRKRLHISAQSKHIAYREYLSIEPLRVADFTHLCDIGCFFLWKKRRQRCRAPPLLKSGITKILEDGKECNMATRYFRKKDINTEGASTCWIEMSGQEFYKFVNSAEGVGRHFIFMDDDIVIEANDQQFREWVTEKNHSDYLRRCENGIETVSLYSDIMSECGSGEELICDPVDIEEEIVKKLRCQALRAAMAELSSENYYLLQKLYFEKNRASERDLAKEFGISQPAIHRRKKKILKNLKLLVIKFEKSQQYIVKGKKRSLSTEP